MQRLSHISQSLGKMKEIVLRIEDSSYDSFIALLNLCPSIEMVAEYSEEEVRKHLDICVKEAIEELRNQKTFRKSSDYTYIMQVINDTKVEDAPFFQTPDSFRDYLREIGVREIPGRSTLYETIQIMKGEYPHWTFDDPKIKEVETLRRNNVGRQFLSTLGRIQRCRSDGFSDKG